MTPRGRSRGPALRSLWLWPAIGLLGVLHVAWSLPWLLVWPTRARRARVACAFARAYSRSVLALAGVKLEVEGSPHLATRPAIFLFNHVNNLDFFVNACVCPPHGLVFGKLSLGLVPVVGWMWLLGGHPLVRRGTREQWQRVMDRVARRMQEDGGAAYLAPEGTRSHDGKLQPFKKGAFHLALTTRAPMVPVVIEGVKGLAGPGAPRPGRVTARVLPPISTVEWREETLDAHVEEVRGVYLRALGQA